MYELKTKVTDANVEAFLATVENDERRSDAARVLDLMRDVTGLEPRMWGPSIIGFGSYHYKYESGHEGDMCRVGFSPRKANLAIYILPGLERYEALLERLGKHKIGKSCLYVNKLEQVDLEVLRELVRDGYEFMSREYPDS